MAAAHSGENHGWLLGFCWNFFEGMKRSIPTINHSVRSDTIEDTSFLNMERRGRSDINVRKLSQSAIEYRYTVRWRGTSEDLLHFIFILTDTTEWSEDPSGDRTETEHSSGQVVRKRSRRLRILAISCRAHGWVHEQSE